MRAVKTQHFGSLLFLVLLLGVQITWSAQITVGTGFLGHSNSPKNMRRLDTNPNCAGQSYCSTSDSFIDSNAGDSLDYNFNLGANAKMSIEIAIGERDYSLTFEMDADPANIQTDIKVYPSDSWPNAEYTRNGYSWTQSLITGTSDSSNRYLDIEIQNNEGAQKSFEFTVTIVSVEEKSKSWIAGVASGVVVVAIIAVLICWCRRIRRRRLLKRQEQARARYESERAASNPPPPQPVIIYQPVYQPYMQQAPQGYPMQQIPEGYQPIQQLPEGYQPVMLQMQMSQNYQPIVQVVNGPPQHYPAGIELAPPMEMVVQNPDEGNLNEENFEHRFPEALSQNFVSSFPQKTCSICLEDIKRDQPSRQLYCEHIFHSECVKVWLLNQMKKQNQGYCPNCNKNMSIIMERAKQ